MDVDGHLIFLKWLWYHKTGRNDFD